MVRANGEGWEGLDPRERSQTPDPPHRALGEGVRYRGAGEAVYRYGFTGLHTYVTVQTLLRCFAGATPKAIEERIAKLKREAKAADTAGADTVAEYSASPGTFGGGGGSGGSSDGRQAAGMKRKRAEGGRTNAGRKRKGKLIAGGQDDEEGKGEVTSMGNLKIEEGAVDGKGKERAFT